MSKLYRPLIFIVRMLGQLQALVEIAINCSSLYFQRANLITVKVIPRFRFTFFLLFVGLSGISQDLKKAAQVYERQCGRCHGVKGGGGTGPSLLRPFLPRAPNDEALFNLIRNGIPGTGMPRNNFLELHEVKAIVTYVRHLGSSTAEEIKGDVIAGETLFQKNGCSTCHIIAGKGGSLGPELTLVGQKRGSTYLKSAIQHPGLEKPVDQLGFLQYLVVSAETIDGSTINGVRLNEDSFTIQIKDATNRIHSVRKADLINLSSHREESLMPGYEDIFDESEIQNLIAYLASLK